MVGRMLCRLGIHSWLVTVGNYPGEDRWYRKVECKRCGLIEEEE